ncbi:MAG: hypothetical protein AAF670_16260 [Planctomycetota bacterium]
MHAAQFAQLASVLSQMGPSLMTRRCPVTPEAINQYWVASRSRLDLWHQTLARFTQARASGDATRLRRWWDQHTGVLEEIMVSEIMTRVVVAVAEGVDRGAAKDDFLPIAHAIHLSHLEARNRVQATLLDRRGCAVADAVRLNQLRRMVERWIDTLVGNLAATDERLIRYGVDAIRVRSHAAEARETRTIADFETIGWLTRTAMMEGLQRKLSPRVSLPRANQAVANSILLMMRSDMFDSVGTLKSLWMHRMEADVALADQMLEEFLQRDLDQSKTASAMDLMHAATLAQWFR